METALYRHWEGTKLLYVGITIHYTNRLSQHRDASPWFRRITKTTVEWLPSRELALVAEKTAIQKEKPECNRAHKTTYKEHKELVEESREYLNKQIVHFSPTYELQDAATTLNIGTRALRILLDSGAIPFFTIGRKTIITGWALLDYIEHLEATKAKLNPLATKGE